MDLSATSELMQPKAAVVPHYRPEEPPSALSLVRGAHSLRRRQEVEREICSWISLLLRRCQVT